ncbi:ficolin-2-like [Drosophila elegans]|uniref:ficolin-2-like n=1 Tax=Drosophila elegans TaxID=30023 RepID=UPI001BC83DEB|nr:ficolin-2-like [Drosophila elegans]
MEQTNKNLESRLLNAERQSKSMYETLTDNIISQAKQLRDKEDFLNTMEQTNKNLESRLVSAERQSKSIYEKLTDQINTQAKQLKENDDLLSSMAQTIKDLKSRLETAEGQSKSFIEERTECPIGSPSGIYKIQIPEIEYFEAPCDGDGWLTIQRRMDGSEDFNRTWEDYKNGFGDVRKEFFLGLEKLYRITDAGQYELYIVLGDVNGTSKYAHYGSFGIDSEAESYRIKDVYNHFLGGPAGHSLIYNAWDKFSTYDRDNDLSNENCAVKHGGGWWYDRCGISTLNGLYLKDGVVRNKVFGIHWGTWSPKAFEFSLTFVEMKIRRINPDL